MAKGKSQEDVQEQAQELFDKCTPDSKVVIESEDGTGYTLQFNRSCVKKLEAKGFSIDAVVSMDQDSTNGVLTSLEQLVCGAFEMHHPDMSDEERLGVWYELQGKEELLPLVISLFTATIRALTADPTKSRMKWSLV